MRKIKALFIGILIGSGVGAKTGALMTHANQLINGFELTSKGLLYGGLLGGMLTVIILVSFRQNELSD